MFSEQNAKRFYIEISNKKMLKICRSIRIASKIVTLSQNNKIFLLHKNRIMFLNRIYLFIFEGFVYLTMSKYQQVQQQHNYLQITC